MINIELLNEYNKIKEVLAQHNIEVSNYIAIDYGIQFTISNQDLSGVVRIYQTKKGGIKSDFSQIKNTDLQNLLSNFSFKQLGSNRYIHNLPIDHLLTLPIIGTDESGKGDYFGPLVAVAAYVDMETAPLLLNLGVKDSKKISDNKILELSQKIISIIRGKCAIIEIAPETYNNLYEQFKKERKNLNTLLAWGHAKAIEQVLGIVECNLAVADKFADERFIMNKLQEKGRRIKLIQMVRAEQNIAVAAASVLARARFLEKLKKLSDEFRISLPKGASKEVVSAGKQFIRMYGVNNLRKVAKLHFKTTKEISGIKDEI